MIGHRVYFVLGDRGVKIGTSWNRPKRVKQLSSEAGQPLELIGEIEGDRSVEQNIHRHLAEYRIKGEWFRDCPEVHEAIGVILRDGEFLTNDQRRERERIRLKKERDAPWDALSARLRQARREFSGSVEASTIMDAASYRYLQWFSVVTRVWYGGGEEDERAVLSAATSDVIQSERAAYLAAKPPTWNVADAFLRGAA